MTNVPTSQSHYKLSHDSLKVDTHMSGRYQHDLATVLKQEKCMYPSPLIVARELSELVWQIDPAGLSTKTMDSLAIMMSNRMVSHDLRLSSTTWTQALLVVIFALIGYHSSLRDALGALCFISDNLQSPSQFRICSAGLAAVR